jgi:hypothetical protein
VLDAVLLVGRDLASQGQPAVEGQVRDGGEEHLPAVLTGKIQLADDPTLVARIVNPQNTAEGLQIKNKRPLGRFSFLSG